MGGSETDDGYFGGMKARMRGFFFLDERGVCFEGWVIGSLACKKTKHEENH